MGHRESRRSISFELLAMDSSGDGEIDSRVSSHEHVHSIHGDDRPDRAKRKRRKSKNRKGNSDSNLGALMVENLGAIEEINSVFAAPKSAGGPLSDIAVMDLISPRAGGVLADLRLESIPLDADVCDVLEAQSAVKESLSPETQQTFSLRSLADDDSSSPRQPGRMLPASPEAQKNLAPNLPGSDSFGFDARNPTIGSGSPVLSETRRVRRNENSREVGSSIEKNLEYASRAGQATDYRSMSPKGRISGRASPAASVNGLSSYDSASAGQREAVVATGSTFAELRQRAVEKGSDSPVQENGHDVGGKVTISRLVSFKKPNSETDPSYLGRVDVIEPPAGYRTPPLARPRLSSHETPQLTEWDRLMAANSEYPATVDLSPLNYLRGEVQRGSVLDGHSSAGMQQRRERIYNTMFHVPWRCELLIDVGFFVCLDSFLSLFTVMPARILMFLWQRVLHWREFQRPYAAELSDFGSLIVLVLGVAVLQQAGLPCSVGSWLEGGFFVVNGHGAWFNSKVLDADISFIYHYIRGQATIKLYVVFNVLEIFDKLCQSFGGDVLQVLLNSAVSIGECPPDRLIKQWVQFCLDQSIAIVTFLVHSLVIMSQAITVSAAINSQNNALLTLLISNNFGEIKSNVFKRVAKENLHKMAYHDTVERFHIMTHLVFVLAQNIQNSEDSWLWNFAYNAGMVLLCELLVDVIKHAFLAKFNEIKPGAYSDFLQALCKQTLNSQSHEVHKTLHFVPLAPACVVLRVLIPLYASFLPQEPWLQRFTGILMLGVGTYIILVAMKIFVGIGLQMHAAWYLRRCKYKEGHPHAD